MSTSDTRLVRSLFLVVAALLCSPPLVLGAGGGVDGGGGGGSLVPGRDQDVPSLSRAFSEGVTFLADGECKRAEKKFIAVLKKVPRNSETNYLRGISLQCQRRHKFAIRYFKRAKRDDAQFYQAYEALGISYLTLERPDLAERELKELEVFKKLCRIGNRICPGVLLKSHRKLSSAMRRTAGQAEDPVGDE